MLDKRGALMVHYHQLESAVSVYSPVDAEATISSRLEEEVDLVYNLNVSPDFNLKLGYSHLFATRSLEVLKGRTGSGLNQWSWLMLTFKPQLFKSKSI